MSSSPRDLAGRFVVITGANTGIGRVCAERLAERGARVVLACRSEERTRPVLDAIRAAGGEAEFVPLDLGDMASARAAGDRIAAMDRPVDILLNNAGLAGQRGITKDGFELAFGTNHVGHFALTMRLLPQLRKAKGARIVNVSSGSHYQAKGIDWDAVRRATSSITGLPEYAVSKLANVLFTTELARRIGGDGIHSYTLHPGTVATDVWRGVPWPVRPILKLFLLSNEDGAKTSLYCATSPEIADHDGRYYDACREKRTSRPAQDPDLARELWQRSVAWTGEDA